METIENIFKHRARSLLLAIAAILLGASLIGMVSMEDFFIRAAYWVGIPLIMLGSVSVFVLLCVVLLDWLEDA